jgi:putative transposase
MAETLDDRVAEFGGRPLDSSTYTFVRVDALIWTVREAGRVVKLAWLVATGVNADGYHEVPGAHVCRLENGAAAAPHVLKP